MGIASSERRYGRNVGLLVNVLVLFLLAGISAAAYVYFRNLGLDDAFITYRVAENATKGLGLVYNEGERVLVSTTPLFTLLLAAVGMVYPDIAEAGAFLGGIGLFTSASFLYLWVERVAGVVAATIASILYVVFPLLLVTMGMETLLYLAFAMAAIYFYLGNRLTLSAISLALMMLTRADGVILGAVVLLHYAWSHRRLPVRQLTWYAALTIPWFVFSQIYYGSLVPATLGAKMAHGQSLWWPRHFLDGLYALAERYVQQDLTFVLFAVFGLVGLLTASRKDVGLLITAIWALLYSVGYSLLGVPDYHWYYAPLVPLVTVTVAIGMARAPGRLLIWLGFPFKRTLATVSYAVPLLLAAVIGTLIARYDIGLARETPHVTFEVYREAGLWLKANAGPNISAAMVEIGMIGYFSKSKVKVIDIIGLTHPDTAQHIAVNDFTYALRQYRPDFVVLSSAVLPEIQSAPWFGESYVPVKYLQNVRFGPQPLVIYGKADAASTAETIGREVIFDGRIELDGMSIRPRSLQPGENLRLNLALRQLQPIQQEIGAFASIVDRSGQTIAQKNVILRPERWKEGRANQHFDIYAPPSTAPGIYEIHSGLFYLPSVTMLPISPGGYGTDDRLRFGPVKVTDPQASGSPSRPISATLGDRISLLGYAATVQPGNHPTQVDVRLFWRANERIQRDLTVFVHLLDEEGRLVTQHDGQPGDGNYPTSFWDANETVLDNHTIQLADSSRGAEYQLAVGMYDASGNRLLVSSANVEVRDDAILVGKISLP